MGKGILYGIGVGPGDPELMTLKAVKLCRSCDLVAIPNKDAAKCVAFQIALGSVPELAEKELLTVDMPMTKDKERLETAYSNGAKLLCEQLESGKNVVFLTLGDPTVYSTYLYLHNRVKANGFETHIVPGITSFCAAAATLGVSLCENSQELHIIPGTYRPTEAFSYPGVKVLMKNNLSETVPYLQAHHLPAMMVENCGMENEHIYQDTDSLPQEASYYSLLIVKE